MSTNQPPARRHSPAVYRRRRLVVLLGLIAVIVAVVLIFVRPGASQGEEPATTPNPSPAATESTGDGAGTASTIPTTEAAADGAGCTPEQIVVEAVTDKTEYAAGEQPNLSLTITNTGQNSCVLNAGTATQVFTVSSGDEPYWTSTDCQVDPVDTEVLLEPNSPVSSSVPIIWDRTRSSVDTCDGGREAVTAGGASYHLTVAVGGIQSATSKQFLLY